MDDQASYSGVEFQPSYWRIGVSRLVAPLGVKFRGGSLRWTQRRVPVDVATRTDWMALRPLMAGICGSDLAVLLGKSSPYLAPLASFPAVLGHEVAAEVTEAGGPWPPGTRVVVDPTLACAARGYPSLCPACQAGQLNACQRRGDQDTDPGLSLGYHRRWPGGWSTLMFAPADQCWPIPDTMGLERAVLAEPLAIVLAGVERIAVPEGADVLVIGGGTIGLLAAWVLRRRTPAGRIRVLARYAHQQRLAQALGATLHGDSGVDDSAAAEVLGSRLQARRFGAPEYFVGGYPVVVDAVGTAESTENALAWTRSYGTLLALGAGGQMRIDVTPLWSRSIRWVGTYGYRDLQGKSLFPLAVQMLAEAPDAIDGMVTHHFALQDFAKALDTIWNRNMPTIKVTLVPSHP